MGLKVLCVTVLIGGVFWQVVGIDVLSGCKVRATAIVFFCMMVMLCVSYTMGVARVQRHGHGHQHPVVVRLAAQRPGLKPARKKVRKFRVIASKHGVEYYCLVA